MVLAANAGTTGGDRILGLTPGDSIRLWWSFAGWPGVTDVVGGSQQLLAGGLDVAPHDHSGAPHILDYNPRTAVGVLQTCSDLDPLTRCVIYLITVDGRQPGWSLGARLPWLTRRFRRYGVWDAANLDAPGRPGLPGARAAIMYRVLAEEVLATIGREPDVDAALVEAVS